jgi:hypothetical protein
MLLSLGTALSRGYPYMTINIRVAAAIILVALTACGGPTPPPARAQAASIDNVQSVCAGQVPTGWIKINDSWNPTTCGNPTSISYNVWTIERYDNKPAGAQMRACFGSVPNGWAMVGSTWDPTACGHPTSISNNVMTIRRLN